MAESVFGSTIDWIRMRFRLGKWYVLQPAWITMSPDGNIWMHPNSAAWREDYTDAPLWLRGHIMHELTHVWQYQQGVNLVLRRHPFCRYDYTFASGRAFFDYGLEQQAEIVRHTYLAQQGRPVAGKAGAAEMAAILPFGPDPGPAAST